MILTQGWDAALQLYWLGRTSQPAPVRSENRQAQEEVAYWKPRLIRRKYTELLQPASAKALSVRIGDETAQYWFPLGTANEELAAAQALQIYRTLQSEGWQSVCTKFSREITVAIFWALSPVAVTYTTIYTLIGDAADIPDLTATRRSRQPLRTVALVEPDLGIQRALAFWLDRQLGVRCMITSADLESLLNLTSVQQPHLLLFNRALPPAVAGELTQTLQTRMPHLPIFGYAVSEDIDRIFVSLTGVKAGYIFRRRVPSELLDPVEEALKRETFPSEHVAQHMRHYFSSLFETGVPVESSPRIANLTARELEILHLLSKGSVDKEIAESLRISVWTVHSHLKKIYEKLQVHTRTEAVVKYLEK